MPEFYHVLAQGGAFNLQLDQFSQPFDYFPNLLIIFPSLSTTLCTQLRVTHPSITSILRCVCTHPIDLMGIHLLCCAHGNKHIGTHDVIPTFLLSLGEMSASLWDKNNYICFLQPHSTPFINELTLCLPKITFAH